jgi:hypothetical protein
VPSAGLLTISFPIASIDLLCGRAKECEGSRLSLPRGSERVFDAVRETRVIMVSKGFITPSGESGESIELDVILDDLLVIAHTEVAKVFLSVASGVNRSEVCLEFANELVVVVSPGR